jgi:alpha-N-acetylglucosamine transferase
LLLCLFLIFAHFGYNFAAKFYEEIFSLKAKISNLIYEQISKFEQNIGITVKEILNLDRLQ